MRTETSSSSAGSAQTGAARNASGNAVERERFDVMVVGARCAGAATAMLLARAGLRVLAVDRARYGSDALSTHALLRTGVLQLSRWGLLDAVRAAGATPVRHTTFHYADDEVRVAIRPRDGVDALYAPRRTTLDALLVDAARRAGADVRHGVRVEELLRGRDERVRGAIVREGSGRIREIEAGLVIGADGIDSSVARAAGAETAVEGRHASAIAYGYWEGLPPDGYHWHYRPGVSAGVIPTDAGRTCVFVAALPRRFEAEVRRDPRSGYLRLLREAAPGFAADAPEARLAGACRSFPGRPGFLRRAAGPGWALVGDAGYFKDPLTAHGISDALRDAELLARAVVQGSERALCAYESERDALSRPLFEVTDHVASFDWSLDGLREHHRRLSESMQPEVERLLRLDGALRPEHHVDAPAATAA